MDRNDVELDGREILHDGFFRMEHFLFRHRLFEGGWSPQLSREILVRNPVAAVIPYDPIRDEIVLIEQFRGGMYAAGDENYEEKLGEPLFSAEAARPKDLDDDATASFENIQGIRMYKGVPGEGTGHLVHEQSYFDRFWEQGARVERFFVVVSKN